MQVIAVDLLDAFFHLANFIAPAFFVALALLLAARLLWPQRARARSRWLTFALLLAVGLAALAGGLWLWGQDARMASYAALVLACASALWLWLRLW